MNQQRQNYGQGNAGGNVGGNTTIAGLYQRQQQLLSEQQPGRAATMHLQAQANHRHQQQFPLLQTRQFVNPDGVGPGQLNHLRAVQQQLQANLAAQQTFQASMKGNQNHRPKQQNIQAPSTMNQQQQQQQQIQQADNSTGTDVIKDLFSQLQAINQKLENLASPNGKVQAAVGAPSNDRTNTIGQPPQQQAQSFPLNTSLDEPRPSANDILHRHRQPQNPASAGHAAARQITQLQPPRQQIHRHNLSTNTLTVTLNAPKQNGQGKTSGDLTAVSYVQKQHASATNAGGGIPPQNAQLPVLNNQMQMPLPPPQQNSATSDLNMLYFPAIQKTAPINSRDSNMNTGNKTVNGKQSQISPPPPPARQSTATNAVASIQPTAQANRPDPAMIDQVKNAGISTTVARQQANVIHRGAGVPLQNARPAAANTRPQISPPPAQQNTASALAPIQQTAKTNGSSTNVTTGIKMKANLNQQQHTSRGKTIESLAAASYGQKQQAIAPRLPPHQNTATRAVARKQPSAATRRVDPNMITSIRILSYKMGQIVKHVPHELADAYLKLHTAQRFALQNTVVFKFQNRARKTTEIGENTPQAIFFLNKLQKVSSLSQQKLRLVGMKCGLCNDRGSYVDGSTSFVDIGNHRTVKLFASVMQSRVNHLLTCPDCKPIFKEALGSYVPTNQDLQNMQSFSEKWLLVVKASFFDVPLHAAPQQKIRVAAVAPITEDSIYTDLVSSMRMGKAMGDLSWDDLSDGIEKLLSPVMEVFLMTFRLESNKQVGIELCCKRTSAESTQKLLVWSFETPFSVDGDFSKRIWDFFQQHYKTCPEVPKGIRKLVGNSVQPPTDELKFVGRKWSEYASRIVWNRKLIQPKPDVKLMRPMYIATPLECLPARATGTFPLKGEFDGNDVVMIGAYREFIGNRRFRRTVSQFRALYSRLPPNKQSLVVEKIVLLIQRRGGSFYSKDGYLARFEESFAFTRKALQNGFADMMHPVIPVEAKSVVFDVEKTIMVDILPNRKDLMNRVMKIRIESFSQSNGTFNRSGRVVDLTKNNDGTEKNLVREGHPIDISTLQRWSQLNRQKDIRGYGKRKQDRPADADSSKRPRKSS